jgi:UrcA family protein
MTMSIIALTLMTAAIAVVPTGSEQPRKVVVQYGDLNLASDEGRDVLDKRLDRAVKIVCGRAFGEPLYIKMAVRKCQAQTLADVAPQRDLAIAQTGVRLAAR